MYFICNQSIDFKLLKIYRNRDVFVVCSECLVFIYRVGEEARKEQSPNAIFLF